ncbi:MAG TPA: 4-alpha-glucanotransferase, partial [Solirubrobacteraceae bacterium]|nr:4-alpha-glucanotransferase [Solirubrobacteraceae bacterium]
RERLGIPGMAVLQFVYDESRPHEDPLDEASRGRVLYTDTHDQDTLMGWWDSLTQRARAPLCNAMSSRGIDGAEPRWALVRLAMSTPAPLVMTQAQDLLGLPSAARMNTPGRARGNWRWRLSGGELDATLARRVRALAEEAGRLP